MSVLGVTAASEITYPEALAGVLFLALSVYMFGRATVDRWRRPPDRDCADLPDDEDEE